MPFTPLHLGPGTVLKAVFPRHVSLSAFALTQVLVDLEPLYNLIHGRWPVHAFFHTYVGVTLVAVVAMLSARLLFSPLLGAWNRMHGRGEGSRLYLGDSIGWRSSALGAFAGAYSHVILDSIMHRDIRPLTPFSAANGLYHLISVPLLHALCILSGLIGVVWLLHLLLIGRYRA